MSAIEFLRNVLQLLVTAHFVPGSQIPVTLMMEAIFSSETSVPTSPTRRNISEYGTLRNNRRKITNFSQH
jgi:hypothetical protein